ncbi:MAG TPA: thioesterase domain-containing protein, partial [Saliniramus sp.]|nr:thioesterase domain-containing protein [Saliniramus sp.]
WPGLGGYPMSLRTLAGEVGLDRPVYGIQAYGINPGEEPFGTVAEMAAEDVRAIRRIQPRGPYTLWGYSFGARLAFETAYQLEQAGDVVEDLFLIAPGSPRLDIENPKGVLAGGDPAYERAFVTILFSVFGRSISGALCDACLGAARDEDSFVAFICEHFPQLEPDQVRRITRIVRLTYEPDYTFGELVDRCVSAPVTIFKADSDDYSFLETCSGFTRQQPAVIALATDHYSLLKMPHVRELVWQIRQRLRAGEAAVPLGRTAD